MGGWVGGWVGGRVPIPEPLSAFSRLPMAGGRQLDLKH